MRHEFEGQFWADNHHRLTESVDRLGYVVGTILSRRRAQARRAANLPEVLR